MWASTICLLRYVLTLQKDVVNAWQYEIVATQADPDDILERDFADHGSAEPARDTFTSLQKIVAATGWSIRWGRSEAAWNNYVHTPMLETALADVEFVQAELMYLSFPPLLLISANAYLERPRRSSPLFCQKCTWDLHR